MFNIFMIFFFLTNNYERESIYLSIYYVLINGWNLSNIFLQYITNYRLLMIISLVTKAIEIIVVINLLKRNLTSRDYN
jgi:hypothetical protein